MIVVCLAERWWSVNSISISTPFSNMFGIEDWMFDLNIGYLALLNNTDLHANDFCFYVR